jgi:hypothetical protein
MDTQVKEIEAGGHTFRVAIATPSSSALLDAEALKDVASRRRVDREIIGAIRSAGQVDALIVRTAADDDTTRWGLRYDAKNPLETCCQLFVDAQLPSWKAIVDLGLMCIIHTGLGPTAAPLRSAAIEAADILYGEGGPRSMHYASVLRDRVKFLGASYDKVQSTVIESTLRIMRINRRRLAARLVDYPSSEQSGLFAASP